MAEFSGARCPDNLFFLGNDLATERAQWRCFA
jgi:hypothetical protein